MFAHFSHVCNKNPRSLYPCQEYEIKIKQSSRFSAVQHERAPRSAQVLPRGTTTSTTIVSHTFCDPVRDRNPTAPQTITRPASVEPKVERDNETRGSTHSPSRSETNSYSPPGSPSQYHGQNNNVSPDSSSKKHTFMSITSILDSKEGKKSPTADQGNQQPKASPKTTENQINFEMPQMYEARPENVYESAVQLLYMSVTWARNIPTFLDLPFRDQAILLEEGWSELFVLSSAQFSLPLDMGPLLSAAGLQVDRAPTEKIVAGMADIRLLQNIVTRFKRLQIDSTEYACLKAIVLFKPGKS